MTDPGAPEQAQFSLYQFFPDGKYERVLSFVPMQQAIDGAWTLSTSVGGRIGTTNRIMITDGGDCCVFEWRFGEGVVFPKECSGWQARENRN